jgi:hypothetical protein
MLSVYFFALGMVCFFPEDAFPAVYLCFLATFRSPFLNGSPYAESNNRASAEVTAVVAMLISKPGSGENESKFARQLDRWFGRRVGTRDLREEGKDDPFESKVDGTLSLIPVEMNAFKIGDSREHGLGEGRKEGQHMRTLKENFDGNGSTLTVNHSPPAWGIPGLSL